MPATWKNVPDEVREIVYANALVTEPYIDKFVLQTSPSQLLSELCVVDKRTSDGATKVFYTENRFDCSKYGVFELLGFLRKIGKNARMIRHVFLDFPSIDLTLDPVRIDSTSQGKLLLIGKYCGTLDTLILGRPENRRNVALMPNVRDSTPEIATAIFDVLAAKITPLIHPNDVRTRVVFLIHKDDEDKFATEHTRREFDRRRWELHVLRNLAAPTFEYPLPALPPGIHG
ncbi:hypothetical protein IQ06DRAFT_349136 [Phaeosphaeriaceae sp. SRC1lsM3a]|nr:hypothetical protein IQ06DRAFT_349136 [Stagonospora sp. SRC1lsM3a]